MEKEKSYQLNQKVRLTKEQAQNILAGVDCPDLRMRTVDCPDLRVLHANTNTMKINVVKFG